jgi:autotransporter-associated beta strand protein
MMIKNFLQSPARGTEHRIWLVGAVMCFFLTASAGWAADRQALPGHVPKAVQSRQALRRLETTNVLRLSIGLPLRNQGALTNLLQELYDPASSNYRRFLSADEFARRFGPAEQDYQAVMEFAKTNGFKVVGAHPNRMLLDVAGAVPDIERAFHLNLRVYRHPTEARDFYAPDVEPQLDLAAPVLHVSGLDNFLVPPPRHHAMPAVNASARTPAPAAGSGPSGNYAGKDFRAAYAPGVTNTGAGQSVGLIEFQGYYASDILTYETNYSLPNIPLNNVLLGGLSSITADAGGAECPLDIEMAIAMATNLSQVIIYCTTRSGNTDTVLNRMATDNSCKQLSCSWGIGTSANILQIFQQFAAQGQSFFNASGDSDAGSVYDDAPGETLVGGTTLVTSGAGGSRTSESVWNWGGGTGSTGGTSPTYGIPVWQQGINMDTNQGSAFMRNVPDVAMTADGVWVLYNNGSSGAFGGTSCAAPLWAGFMALVNQQAAANGLPPVGFLNPALYALGKGTNYAAVFHDITTGNNTSSSSPKNYYAVPGYDLCTGWGTPNGSNLINALVFSRADTLVVTPANNFVSAGPVGGAFIPASGTFSLANYGGNATSWSLINISAWFTVSPASGTLAVGASTNVTVSVAAAANSLTAGYYSATLLFSNASTHFVQSRSLGLVVGSALTWNSDGSSISAALDGSGVWADQSAGGNTNWWNGGNFQWNNAAPGIAIFGATNGAAGTATLGSAITAAGINFNAPGSGNYTVAGGGNTLTLSGYISASNSATVSAPVNLGSPGTFNVVAGQTLTVSGLISGTNGNSLAINGPGTVSLTGQNNSGSSAGMAGVVTVNSGVLSLNSGGSTYGTLGNVAGITVGSGAVLSLQGNDAISGSSGTARTVTVNNGTVTNNGGSHALGALTFNGGTLSGAGTFSLAGDVFANSNAVISAQNVSPASGKSFNVASGKTLACSGNLTGSGGLTFAGAGTLVFSGTNNSSAGTTIRAGTLQVGNGGTGGSLGTGAVTNGGLLQFNRSDNFTWATPVIDPSYSGTFIKLNTNTETLTATNSFLATSSGGIQINGGTLQINSSGVLQSGAEFWIAQNASTGACIINGGTLIVSNWLVVGRNNSAALGTLTLNSGLIQETGNGGNIIMGSLGANGTLTVNGGTISNNTAIWLGENSTGKGTLNLNGGLVQALQVSRAATTAGASAIVNFNGGTLQAITNQANLFSVDQVLVKNGGAVIDDGGYSVGLTQGLLNGGSGGLTKSGVGTLTLSATNTYAGATTVNAGTLRLNDPILHFSFDNVVSGTNVTNDGAGGPALNGTLTGTATIVSGGRFGSALSIPSGMATNAYVLVNNSVVPLNCTSGSYWTVAMWLKTSTAGAVYLYQGDGGWASGNTEFYLENGTQGDGAGTHAGGVRWGQGWQSGTAVITNGWHFVTMTCSNGVKAMYVDGAVDNFLTGAQTNWTGAGTGGQVRIGGTATGADSQVGLNGLIDEVYIYNRALSMSDVKSLMTNNIAVNHQVLPPATAVTLNAGATLDLGGFNQTIGSLAGTNSSGVLLSGSTNADTLTVGNSSNTVFAGSISGNGSVTKAGTGTLTLSGVNSYSGATTLNAGTLAFGQSNNSNVVAALQPVLWLTFDQVGSGVVTNLGTGGSAMNGTLTGTASIVSGGRYGKALNIPDGAATAAYVLVNNAVVPLNATAGNSWSVGLWLKTATAGAAYFYQGDGGWASGNTEFYLENGTAGAGAGTHAGGVRYAQGWESGTATINNSAWHFVVMTCNSGTKALYVDGALDAFITGVDQWNGPGTGGQVRIGGTASGADSQIALGGLIDEIYMFNRALSQSEIRNLLTNQPVEPVLTIAGQLPATTPVNIAAGATLDLAGTAQTIASLANVAGGGGSVTNSSGTNAMLTISGSGATNTFSGQINNAGNASAISLVKTGNSTQILAGANTYSGTTTVSNGSLLVNGSLGTNAVMVSGGLLGGNGVLGGPVTIQPGGTLSPGNNSIGALTISNTLTLAGTTFIEINKSVPTNDVVRGLSTVNYGGALTVTNLSGTLAANDSFQLFSAGSTSGAFAATNLPALGPNLVWNFNPASGVLSVIQPVATNPTNISYTVGGGNLTLSWPADHLGWRLQAQTNDLSTGLGTNWFDVPGSTNLNSLLLPVDVNRSSVFYRLVYP